MSRDDHMMDDPAILHHSEVSLLSVERRVGEG